MPPRNPESSRGPNQPEATCQREAEREKPLIFSGVLTTERGPKHIKNEDAGFFDEELGLVMVADGVGGSGGGDIASQAAKGALEKAVEAIKRQGIFVSPGGREIKLGPNLTFDEARENLKRLFTHVSLEITKAATRRLSASDGVRPATTLIISLVAQEDGEIRYFTIGCGDSRAYIIGKNGLKRIGPGEGLASDDALQTLVAEDFISEKAAEIIDQAEDPRDFVEKMSDQGFPPSDKIEGFLSLKTATDVANELRSSNSNNEQEVGFLKAYFAFLHFFKRGIPRVFPNGYPDFFKTTGCLRRITEKTIGKVGGFLNSGVAEGVLEDGEAVFLATDGLADVLTERKMNEIISATQSLSEAAEELRHGARDLSQDKNYFRGKNDDLTIVSLQVQKDPRWQPQKREEPKKKEEEERIFAVDEEVFYLKNPETHGSTGLVKWNVAGRDHSGAYILERDNKQMSRGDEKNSILVFPADLFRFNSDSDF